MSEHERIPAYLVIGRVIDRRTRQGVPGLRVEAWDKDLLVDDLIGSDVTDAEGRFRLSFGEEDFRELFADRRPDLFFRVHDHGRRIASTENSVLWNVRAGATEVAIEIDRPGPIAFVRLSGRLVAEGSSRPLAGYRIHGTLVESGSGSSDVDLGYDLTDGEGRFALAVPRRAAAERSAAVESASGTFLRRLQRFFGGGAEREGRRDGPESGSLRVRLRVSNRVGDRIHETEVAVHPEDPDIGSIRVPVPDTPEPDAIPIEELVSRNRPVPRQVVSALRARGVRTLADVRRAGGLARLPDLGIPAEHPALAELEAQANLSILGIDLQTSSRLIDAGYTSVLTLAATPRTQVVESIRQSIGEEQAEQVHAAAIAGASYLDNATTAHQAELAAGRTSPYGVPGLTTLLNPPCGCRDCEAAVSPAAYLADLVDYIRRFMRDGFAEIDLAALTRRLYQPFGRLPAECDAVETQVRQVRICIEVLRGYLADNPPDPLRRPGLDAGERDYRRAAYVRLLNEIGTSLDELGVARTAGQAARNQAERERAQAELERLADRIGVNANRVLDFFLDPTAAPDPVTETALEDLFGLVSTDAGRDPLDPPRPSQLRGHRLERLASLWHSQDWPDDQIPDGRPIVDPDVIGPDDFRAPFRRANANDPRRAFDLWLERRSWVDDRLAALLDPARLPSRSVRGQQMPDYFAGMFAAMYVAVPGLQDPPWRNTTPADFRVLASRLNRGTRDEVERARQTLSDDLALGIEAFTRLTQLQEKDRRWVEHPTNPAVSAAEWQDVASMLVQAMKWRIFPAWRQEEVQAQQPGAGGAEPALVFGPRDFWLPEMEPVEGDWPPMVTGPFVDPERVEPRDLPEWVAGAAAQALWQQRRDELEQIRQRLQGLRETQGLQAALAQALGPTLPHDLDDLLDRLNAIDSNTAATARTQVEQDLHMTVEAFRHLMEVRARDRAASQPGVANPPAPPAENEWAAVYDALTSAEKVQRRYAAWTAEEQGLPAGPLPYWLALKARLPRWRADARSRSAWQQVLRVRSRRPILDPDVVERRDLVHPWPGRRAYDLWDTRSRQLDALQTGLRQTRTAAATALDGFDAICRQTLGHDSQVLLELERLEQAGHDLRSRLEGLDLTRSEYLHLLRLRLLVDAAAPILDSAWSDGEAALTKVYRRRRSSIWREEDRAAGLTLRPELFHLSAEDADRSRELPAGSRRDPIARREWRSGLSSRLDQQQSLLDGITRMIGRVEEAMLPLLRDALVSASNPPGATGNDREARGKRLADLLLIETGDNGCALTTRVSQAIATLQGYIWSVRTGQLRDTYPLVRILDDHFDERWTWLGSYSSWRAATFVHLYPENLLVPSLRREQSWGFRRFLEDVRQRRRQIGPRDACEIAHAYADYYRDVASLRVEASCHALTDLSGGPCESRTFGGRQRFTYWFGRAPSGRCYWSRSDPDDPTSQTLWELIPGLEKISALPGAVPFRARDLGEYILLFAVARTDDVDQLLMTRYSLSALGWVPAVELGGPDDAPSFRAVVNQQRILAEWVHPGFPDAPGRGTARVIIQVPRADETELYERRVNAEGTGWDSASAEWTLLATAPAGWRLLAAVPVRSNDTVPCYLFFQAPAFQSSDGILWYRIVGDDDYPQWHPFGSAIPQVGSGQFLGAFLWPAGDQVFALWKAGGVSTRVWRLVPPTALPFEGLPVFVTSAENTSLAQRYDAAELPAVIELHGFNNWLMLAANRNLHEITPGSLGAALGASTLFDLLTFPASHPSRAIAGGTAYGTAVTVGIGFFEQYLAGNLPGTVPTEWQAWQRANRLVLASSDPRLDLPNCLRQLFGNRLGTAQPPRMRSLSQAADTSVSSLASLQPLGVDSGQPRLNSRLPLAFTGYEVLRGTFAIDSATSQLVVSDVVRLAPRETNSILALAPAWPGVPETIRRARTEFLYTSHAGHPASNLTYLDEYYYFVPLQLATELQRNGHFVAALDWYRTVYDHAEPSGRERKIWYGLVREESLASDFSRIQDWLLDPLNPHAVARTRFNTYTRFTVLSLIRCFLAYADDEFTRDTSESLERARILYRTALELLDAAELRQGPEACAQVIGSIEVRLSDPSWRPVFEVLLEDLARIHQLPAVEAAAGDVRRVLQGEGSDEERMLAARQAVDDALARQPAGRTFGAVVQERARMHSQAHMMVLANDAVAASARSAGRAAGDDRRRSRSLDAGIQVGANGSPAGRVRFVFDPGIAFQFCIPPNPIVEALRLSAGDNLQKLRACRNIAGAERQVEPYAGDTTAARSAGAAGQLTSPAAIALRPTPYRHEVLIARAKELVQVAAQVEASLLSAIEKRDQELYNQLKARQDIRLAAAGVRLQDLRVREAEGAVVLAALHRDRAEFQVNHYDELIREGRTFFEELALRVQEAAVYHLHAAAAIRQALTFGFGGIGEVGSALAASAALYQTFASYERRHQEWEFQRDLARFDVRIGDQQVRNAEEHVAVTTQERAVAQLQAEHAEQGAEFIANKFGNAELYDWMADILEEVYAFFLHQATATARLALAQLAFERQQVPPPLIRDDYWEVPGDGTGPGSNGTVPDRRGLTGSARLLRDIQELEQFAFDTQRQKLELRRTISLARLAPFEFARFRETGVMTFATPLELFDRDFPGHYLRQVKQVRVSVIALVPPAEGIRATLTSSRISRIVIGGDLFETVRIDRGPEQVALTTAQNASGLLDLEPRSELLRPFEGIGVDTLWELRMPRAANPFDFGTIADVLVTIDYTALNSFDYRQQVVRSLPATITADRAFSFRNQFADQWYDLHNPDLTQTPMTVRFRTRREDFPPSLDDLTIQHVLLYFARKPAVTFEMPVAHLQLIRDGVATPPGAAVSIQGIISTRRGNAASWLAMIGQSPVAEWELALSDTAAVRRRFTNEEIEDLLLVITYRARTQDWPM